MVTFNQRSYTFNEGTREAQPVIIFSNPSSFDIVVNLMTDDITATGVNSSGCSKTNSENDYQCGEYSVRIPPSTTFQVMNISICDDIVLERNETFSFTIVSNSHPDNVTNGSPDSVTIIIVDNDRKFLFSLKCNHSCYICSYLYKLTTIPLLI